MPTDLYAFLDASHEKPVLKVNGEAVAVDLRDGYARLRRDWKDGDTVDLVLPMPVRRIVANAAVAEDSGRVAIQRGPLVYAAEGIDNDGRVFDLVLPDAAPLTVDFRPDLLDGVAVVIGSVAARPFQAVPYYAWANRGPGQMLVWLPRTAAAVRPPKKIDMNVD
jgi:DUF1680 family protein